jgi:hypothetical protein
VTHREPADDSGDDHAGRVDRGARRRDRTRSRARTRARAGNDDAPERPGERRPRAAKPSGARCPCLPPSRASTTVRARRLSRNRRRIQLAPGTGVSAGSTGAEPPRLVPRRAWTSPASSTARSRRRVESSARRTDATRAWECSRRAFGNGREEGTGAVCCSPWVQHTRVCAGPAVSQRSNSTGRPRRAVTFVDPPAMSSS